MSGGHAPKFMQIVEGSMLSMYSKTWSPAQMNMLSIHWHADHFAASLCSMHCTQRLLALRASEEYTPGAYQAGPHKPDKEPASLSAALRMPGRSMTCQSSTMPMPYISCSSKRPTEWTRTTFKDKQVGRAKSRTS